MTQTTLVILVVAVVIVLIVIGLVAALSGRGRRLRPLPDESKDRYATSWKSIEARFIDDPTGSVRDADKLAVMVLSERGATLDDDRSVPDDMRSAREAAASDQGRQGTEGLRRAMVHYKRVVDDAVGTSRIRRDEEEGRREVAS